MLTSNEVARLIADHGKPGIGGRLAYVRRASRNSMNGGGLTESQRSLADDLAATPPTFGVPSAYAHPGQGLVPPDLPLPRNPNNAGSSLSASQVAFLTGLPEDPGKVPYDAAVEVFKLAKSVSAQDWPLVNSVASPLLVWHSRKEAEAELQAAKAPPPAIPESALSAIADSILEENPSLRANEALGRAADAIEEIGRRRLVDHQTRLAKAHDRIAKLDAADAARTAVTR